MARDSNVCVRREVIARLLRSQLEVLLDRTDPE